MVDTMLYSLISLCLASTTGRCIWYSCFKNDPLKRRLYTKMTTMRQMCLNDSVKPPISSSALNIESEILPCTINYWSILSVIEASDVSPPPSSDYYFVTALLNYSYLIGATWKNVELLKSQFLNIKSYSSVFAGWISIYNRCSILVSRWT